MKVSSINSVQSINASRPNFKGVAKNPYDVLPSEVIQRFGLNMKARVGYQGVQDYTPAPKNVDNFFRKLKVNWATHVDENVKKPMY